MTIYLSAPIYLEEKYYKNLIKNNTYIIDDYAFDIFKYTKELFSNQINIKQKTILDVGCNIGTFSFLAQEMGAKYVTGFDIDSIFIKLCFLTQVDLNKHNMLFLQQNLFDINLLFQKKYDMIFLQKFTVLEKEKEKNCIKKFKSFIYTKPSTQILYSYYKHDKKSIVRCVIEDKYKLINYFLLNNIYEVFLYHII